MQYKNLKSIYLISFFIIASLIHVSGQTIFLDDFGQHTTRVTSPYMPSGSYSFADPNTPDNPTTTGGNYQSNEHIYANEIENNYYAVIAPANIYTTYAAGYTPQFQLWSSASAMSDHTGNANGAVMVVNAGITLQSFYERPVTLQKGISYRASFWLYVVNTNSTIVLKVKSGATKTVLGSASTGYIGTGGSWVQYTMDFTMPTGLTCTNDVYFSLENAYSNNAGNDYYVDDIKLEQIATPSAPFAVACSTESFPSKYLNTAIISGDLLDPNSSNNNASVTPVPKPILLVTNPAAVCSPATVDITASVVTAGSTSTNVSISYWTNAAATLTLLNPSAVSTSGTYYIKSTLLDGGSVIEPVVVTINPKSSLSIGDVTMAESAGYATFNPTLSAAAVCDITFTPSFTNGTALIGTDTGTPIQYSINGGTSWTTWTSGDITIPAGIASIAVRIPVTDDNIAEGSENLQFRATVTSGNTSNATAIATGTITDNDNAVTVSIAATTQAAEDATNGLFTISIDKALSTDLTVNLATTGTAINGTDMNTMVTSVTIPAGQFSITTPVTVKTDAIAEGTETVILTLGTNTGAPAGVTVTNNATDNATVNITDNDNAVTVSIAATTQAAEDATNGLFTISIDKALSTDLTVNLATTGTAINGTDMNTMVTSVTIPAGQFSITTPVTVKTDAIAEGTETVILTLATNTGAPAGVTVTNNATDNATVNITDNDVSVVSISATTASASEPSTNGEFTVSLSNQVSTPTVVTYTVTGTATNGTDYTSITNTVTIPANTSSVTIPVTVSNDNTVEPSETVIITLNGTDNAVTVTGTPANATATVNIADNDGSVVSISATTASASEPSTNGEFTVSLSNQVSTPTVVTYTVTGTATNGTDYTSITNTVTIPANTSSVTIPVTVKDDNTSEGSESVIINLINTDNAVTISTVAANAEATVIISDNDDAPTVTIGDASATEGGDISLPVTLSNPSATDITVTIGFTNVSTVNGDYTTTPVTVTFLAGSTSATAVVPTTQDFADESDETFTAAITSTTGTVGTITDTAIGTITDNDDAPTVTIGDASATEGGDISLPVTLSNPSATDITVTIGFTNVSTVNGDYTTTPVTVTFLAGSTSATAVVPTTQDFADESDETFTAAITSTTGTVGTITDTAIGTITDNDGAPTVTIGDASATEGGDISLPVTLSNPSATDITVTIGFTNVSTVNGDYTTTPVTVTFLAGSTSATAVVPTTQDFADESDETFTAAITGTTGTVGTITDTAIGTITDNDGAPSVTIGDASATEGGDISLPVTLSNPSATDITVTIGFTNVSTVNGDYTTTPVTVTFLAGSTSATAVVPTTQDFADESDETFTAAITSTTGTVGTITDTAIGTITDNDGAPTVTIGDASATEGGDISLPVTLSNPSATDITVTIGFTNVSTINGDYTTTPVTVTFLAGSTSATAVVPTTQDFADESDETFTAAITSTTGTVGTITDTAIGTITDNDGAPTVTIGDASATEGGDISLPVTLSNPSATDITVTIGFTNVSTVNGDYTTTPVTVTFLAGSTSATAVVPTTQDLIDESDETFTAAITSTTGTVGTITDTAIGTITDNDGAPTVTIGDASATEGGDISLPVTLSNPSATDITVTIGFTNVSTVNGDYTTTPVTVTFLAGSTSATAVVPTTQDLIDESDETFTAAITGTTGTVGTITDTAIGTITDNDDAPTVTIGDASATEGGDISLPVTLSNPSATDITVTIGFTNVSTVNGDYTTTPVTVTFLAGSTSATAVVPTTQDFADESDETFTAAVTGTTGTVGTITDTAIGTITDNDDAPTVTIGDASATEGGDISLPVTLSNPSATDITVTIGFTNVSTVNGDYTTTPVTVTFLAGSTSATAVVPTTQDFADESDETFTAAVTGTTGTVGTITDTAIGTITDNDDAPTVTIGDASATEGGDISLPVTLSNPSATDITVTIGFTNVSTVNGDYTTTPVTVTFLAGSTSATAVVPTTQDFADESDETFTAAITGTTGTVGTITDTAIGTITDNDGAPSVTIGDASATEGGDISLPVTLSNPSATDITVTIGFTNVSTVNGDYTTTPVTVTFLAGSTSATAVVPTTQDFADESDETFTAAITSTTGTVGTITDTAIGTITDNDGAPTVTIGDASATEGGDISLPVTLSNPSATDITVTIGFTNVSTINGDYTTTPVTVTFLAGSTSATAVVPTTQDFADESDETFTAAITSTTGTVGTITDTAIGTITDNDGAPTVTIGDASATEGGDISLPVTLSNPSATDITVTIGFTNVSTVNGDYTTTPVTVTFLAGSTSATAVVPTTQDLIDESDETFTAAITGTTGTVGTITDTAIGTITDNDGAPTVTIGDASATEGGDISLPVTLSNPSATDITVTIGFTNVSTVNGDYTTTPVTVTFLAGSTSATAVVPTTQDLIDESDETFTAAITSTTGTVGTITDTAIGTITDNDGAPTVTIGDASATEGGDISLPVTLSNPSATDITVTIGFTNVSTVNGDYTTTPVTVTFLAGSTSATAVVPTTQDLIDESDETFTAAITGTTGTVGTITDTAIGTITDNDDAPTVTIGDASATEGGDISLPVTLSNPSATDITVTIGFTNVSTVNGDYTTTPVTVTFLAGSTSATAVVPTTQDFADESDETFTAAVTGTTGTVGTITDTAIGTITDNDDAPTVTIGDASATEGGDISLPVTLSNPSATDITVTIGFTNVSTVNGDYTTTPVTVTFLAGSTSATAVVPTTQDFADESDETFTAAITSTTGTVGTITDTAIGTITDNDDAPTVTIGDASATEGGDISLPVTLSNPSATDITVTIGFTNVSTVNGDYTTTPVTVTFLAGSTSATAVVPTTQDFADESDETFTAAITGTTGTVGTITDTAIGTITDNDDAPTVTIGDASATEGGDISLPVTLSNPSATDITVTIGFTNVSTVNGDYTTTPVTVTFLAGSTSATAVVPTTQDFADESDETFTAAVTGTTGTVGTITDTAIGTITDNDDAPTVTIGDASATEGGDISLPVTLSNPSATDITVTIGFTNVSTVNGDYTTTPVTVTFLAGSTSATAVVPTTQDFADESDETFTAAITGTTGTVGTITDTAIGTITDNDDAPTVTIGDASATEGGDISLPVTLSNPSATDITVTIGFTNVSTVNGDYTTTPVTVTFLAGSTSATAVVPTTQDLIDESDETFTAAITGTTGTVGTITDTAIGTITDNDDAPTVTIGDASATEGGDISLPVTLSNPSATDITVTIGFTNVSTVNGDYTTTPVTVTFLAGSTSATAVVPTTQDFADESDETFTAAITGTTGTVGTITDTAIGTITDNDDAPTVTIGDASATEGGDISLPVTLSNPSATDITVTIGFTNVSTVNGDYTTTPVTVTFLAGSTSATAVVPTTQDLIDESDETFTAAITGTTGTVGTITDTAIGTITDNDDAPTVTIGDASATEGGDISLPVTLSNPSATDITVTIGFTNVSTVNGDYTTTPVTVTFLAGSTSATAVVPTTQDLIDESDETFTAAITGTTGTVGTITDTAIGTITDNDGAPTVTIGDASATEGGDISLPVTLSNPSATDITVTIGFTNVSTVNGDYTTTPVTVTFLAGSTSATAVVPTTQDLIDESDETFTAAITGTTGTVGTITDTAIGTITDNDGAPTVTIGDASATEGGDISLPVTLSNPSATDITVTIGFTNVSTVNGDYTTTPVTVTFLAGSTSATAVVPTTQDLIDESDETFTAAITGTTGTVGTITDTAIGTITDNDGAPTVTIGDASATEGGDISLPVTLSNPSATDITVTIGFTNVSTVNGDYTTTPVTVTFLAGSTSATAVVPTTQDLIDESDETFTAAITGTTGTVGTITDTAIGTITDNDNIPIVSSSSITVIEASVNTTLGLTSPIDVDNNTLTITVTGLPNIGNIKLLNGDILYNGQTLTPMELIGLVYDAPADYNGTDAIGIFKYSVTDGGNIVDGQTIIIVTPTNDIPVVDDPTNPTFDPATKNYNIATTEDTAISGSVKATDADGDALNYTKGNDPTHGTVIVNTDGTYTYTPATNYNGNDSFTVTVSDGNGGTTTSTINVVVTPANDIPVINDPTNPTFDPATKNYNIATTEDTAISGSVKATDADGDALNYTKGNDPTHGTVIVNVDGTYTYTPATNYNGNDSFTVTVSDGNGGTTTSTINVVVTPANDIPVINDPTNPTFDPATKNYNIATTEDTAISGSVKATDADGDALNYTKGNDPTHGTVIVNTDGTYTYTPATNYNGNDSFTVTVSDGNGGTTTSTINVVVTPANDIPVINDPTNPTFDPATKNYNIATTEDTAISGSVKATDADGDALNYTKGNDPTHGTVIVNVDGTYTYTPATNYNGNDSFTVTVSDGNGGTTTSTINVVVTPANDIPVINDPTNPTFDPATKNYNIATTEDTAISGSVKATDADGDALNYTKGNDPTHGTVIVNVDGTYTYTPATNYNGNDSFTVTVSDGNGGTTTSTINVVVTPANDIPVINDPTNPTFDPATKNYNIATTEDTAISGSVKATDADGDALNYTKGNDPAHGTVIVNVDGTYTYTPATNYNGNDSFTVTVSDGNGGTTTSTINVVVTPANDIPVINDPTNPTFDPATKNYNIATTEDTAISGSVKATDADGDALNYTKGNDPTHGTVIVNTDGTYTYTPATNYNGNDSFTVTVSDGNGGTTTSTINVVVTPANDIPVINDPTNPTFDPATKNYNIATTEDTAISGSVKATDADGDALNYTKGNDPTHGTVIVNVDGTYTYTPATNYNGNDSFTVTVSDGNGGTTTATVSVTVDSVNDNLTLTAVLDPISDSGIKGDNKTNDTTPTINGTGEAGASITVLTPKGETLTTTVKADGTWTVTPATALDGGLNTMNVTENDDAGNTTSTTVPVTIDTTAPTVPTINPVTDVATTVTGKGEPGATVTVTYPNGDTSTATVQPDGTWTSTIPSTVDLNGGDIVTAKQTDPSGNTSGSATTIVTTSMTSTNTAPIATATAITTLQDKSVSEKITATDADGDVLTYSTSTNPLHGTLIVNIDGSYKYTPNNNFHGNDSFSVTVSDGKGGIAVATVSVNVLALPKFTKKSSIPVPNVDGTFSWTYTITVNNDTDQRIDSIQVIDDLDKVFRTKGCEYTVTSTTASGKLIANGLYKGYNNTGTLIRESSYLEPNTVDSIMIQVTVNSHQFIGEVYNQALLSGYIPSGKSNFSNIVSDDLSLPGVNDSTVTIVPAVALYIPDGFSPNDDAFNQTFVIKHSEATRIDLEVYNRWGNKVYQSSDYQNNWDGKGIGNFLGKDLPAGTYFCTCRQIEISTGKIISNGVKSITLRR